MSKASPTQPPVKDHDFEIVEPEDGLDDWTNVTSDSERSSIVLV